MGYVEYFFSFWLFLWYFYGTRRGSFPSFQTNEISLGYPAGALSIVSNNPNFVGVPGGEAFDRFKQPKFRWGTRRGSFPSFQTNEISLGYPAGKLSIVSNNRNFGGVHEEEAFHRF